ncbi:ribonuclease domain-containing protein [Lysobacter niabensis]|uniref:ribonuclease domain-containing protein n=1 Tax=Agrilutibacter niabensis TaxID=380628 RepID=UPI003617AD4B
MRHLVWILVALLVLGLWLGAQQRAPSPLDSPAGTSGPLRSLPTAADGDTGTTSTTLPAFLPAEAHEVLRRIAQGGPFEHRQDGGVFQNRERQLPPQPRGYYREYTVETPGSRDRGARRIITGGQPPREYWYTDDHYRSFRRFQVGSTEVTP